MLSPWKKSALVLLIGFFVIFNVVGTLVLVQPAKAIPVEVTASAPDMANKVQATIGQMIQIAVLNAALQAMSYFARKIAYDSAVWLASGGKGQNPFAHTKNFGDYISNVADNAVGMAIEALGAPFGLNLCHIPDLQLDLALRIGISCSYGGPCSLRPEEFPPKPACTFSEFKKEWTAEKFKSKYGAGNIEDRFNTSFSTDDSDLGIYLTATAKMDNLQARAVTGKSEQRKEDQGSIGFTDLISGNIKTPGAVMMEEIKAQSPSKTKQSSDQQINSAFSAGVYQILPATLSTFLNTLATQMINNFQTKGMFPFGIGYDEGGSSAGGNYFGQGPAGGVGGRKLAQEIFSEYLTASIKVPGSYDLLSHLTSCPVNLPANNIPVDNCVMDQDLMTALQQSNYGNPITIREALDQKILRGDKKLLPPTRKAENADPDCYIDAYCYRNVQVMRQARILPLGFEIAAYLSDADNPWTLEKVVAGFDECDYRKDAQGNVIGINYDPVGHPFCHLIDPNWILKLPETRCNAMSFGPSPVAPGLPNRGEECTDFSSCVAHEGNKCIAYGYCTREENIWKFNTDNCEPQYNSCRVFTDSIGSQVGYLYRTLDTNNCDESTVGCRAYSLTIYEGLFVGLVPFWAIPVTPLSIDRDNIGVQQLAYINNGIYFNKGVSTACAPNTAGCTAFNFVNNPEGQGDLYLRKAPDYLKCYDAIPDTAVLDWPQTPADLSRLQPRPDCAKYAKPCIPDEVDCNKYTPVDDVGNALADETIPGKYTPVLDECASACVGYAAYREMPSNFSNGQPVAYIIPNSGQPYSGQPCTQDEEGCTSFTNLGTTEEGLEKVEYYSFLRSCILPDQARQKTFYTYAGSSVNGYQLEVYVLEQDETGGPKYFYRTPQDLLTYQNDCNENIYRSGSSPDCRQFNDAKGQTYYRKLSQTVAVSEQCTPYRLNNTEFLAVNINQAGCRLPAGRWKDNQCQACFQNGELREDGYCYYYGLPAGVKLSSGESTACSASVNTCRKYKGSRGNDVRRELNADFDRTESDLAKWQAVGGAVVLSPESTHLTEHSLGYTGPADGKVQRVDLSLEPDQSYEVSFWAKGGNIGSVQISLVNDAVTSLGSTSVGDVWRYYQLETKILAGTVTSTALEFKITGAGKLFLDNVEVLRLNDVKYLVKNTLKVDPLCDSNLEDNLPGEALGCTEYKDNKNNSKYLTNFSYLCRNEAIGCTALLDTRNTLDTTQEKIFNVWVQNVNKDKLKSFLGLTKEPCTSPQGATGCYVDEPIVGKRPQEVTAAANGGEFTTSTIYIPADTPTTSPIYLVASEEQPFNCTAASIGCVEAGAQVPSPIGWQFETTTIQNNPAQYTTNGSQKGILCGFESVGCNAFTSATQGNAYFKDPKLVGQKICTYLPDARVHGLPAKGWFWKGVGACKQNINTVCATNADCPAAGDSCDTTVNVPCYPNFIQGGNDYGLWSFGNKEKYTNFVGECPSTADNCKEFMDRGDFNEAYYLIADNRLNAGDCGDGISRKAGCILLDDTGQPNKLWNTALTYKASDNKSGEKVPPVVAAIGANDANTIVKVTRDRECAEWIYHSQIHQNSAGTNKSYGLGVCNKAQSGIGFISQCANDISTDWEGRGNVLDEQTYVRRNISWIGREYSGYSLFNSFQIADLKPIEITRCANNCPVDYQLVHESIYTSENDGANAPCRSIGPGVPDQNGKVVCGRDNDKDEMADGRCYNFKCVYTPYGRMEKGKDLFSLSDSFSERLICRGYPEVDSPFNRQGIVKDENEEGTIVSFEKEFDNVNVCEKKDVNNGAVDCDCSYKKVVYGNNEFVKYYGGGNTPPTEITNNFNGVPATAKETKFSNYDGWQGYCVQRDIRRQLNATGVNACLTWYPVDVPKGVQDLGTKEEAGVYFTLDGEKYLCIKNEPIQLDHQEEVLGVSIDGQDGQQYHNDFNTVESAIDDNMRRMFELPNMVVGWTSGRDGDGRPIEYNNSFDILYIPINARAVARSNFWISTKNDEDNSHSEHERYEKFVRLNYDDVLGTLNSNKWLRKDDLLRVTVLFESENLVANTAPNIIVFKTHPGNPDPNSQDSNYAYKMGAGFTEGTLGVGNGRINYTEWKSGNNINFLTQAWAGGRLPLGAAVAQSTDQDSHAGDGYGVRVLFDNDGFLKGLWLIASRDTNDQTDDIKLGFFVMLHFTNGKCKYLAKISNSVSNRNGAASEIKVKGVAWRLIDDKVEGLHDLVNGGIFLTRAFDYQYNPYGVVKGGKTSSLYVNPFSLPSYANDDNFNIDDNFKTDLTENFGPNFTGGISISTYANKQEGDRFGDDDCNIPFKRDPTADYGYCSMLYQMFAKVFEVTEFNGNSYVAPQSLRFDIKDAASPIWAREVGSAVAKPFDYYVPKIGSVDMLSCLSPGPAGCGMNRLNQFTVNTTDDEDVYIAGSGIASIKFFAWADAAQMPLRSFKVDFDNGATIYQSDSKNHANYKYLCGITTFCKGANSEDSNIPCENNQQCAKFNNTWTCQEPANGTEAKKRGGFGSTTDKGCTERFYEIFGNYSCDVKDLYDPSVGRAVWKEDIAAEKKYGNGGHFAVMRNKPVNSWDILLTQKAQWMGLTDGSVVCAYRPKVQILDNWGWCSGRCVKDYTARGQPIEPATNGCYNELKEYIHQCGGYVGANPWLPFGGFDSEKNVIVIPSS